MNGVARSVNSIALQGDLLGKSNVITSPIFSGIDRQIDGVHFNLNALLNVSAVRYTSFVSGSTDMGLVPNDTGAASAGTTQDTSTQPATPFGSAGSTPLPSQSTPTQGSAQQSPPPSSSQPASASSDSATSNNNPVE